MVLRRVHFCWGSKFVGSKTTLFVHTKARPAKGDENSEDDDSNTQMMSGWWFPFKIFVSFSLESIFFSKKLSKVGRFDTPTPQLHRICLHIFHKPLNHLRSPGNSLMTSLKRSCHFAARLSRQAIRRSWGWTRRRFCGPQLNLVKRVVP